VAENKLEVLNQKLEEAFKEFLTNAEKNLGGVKVAGVRARKLSLQITQDLKEYRKLSVNL